MAAKKRTIDVASSDSIAFSSLILSSDVLNGLQKFGFINPSPVQLKSIPLGKCGLDLIVQAKSGTGKTCVFAVVALEMVAVSSAETQVILLAPTREIAVQICRVVCEIGSFKKKLQCHVFIGGTSLEDDKKKLLGCHIAIGTPGRVKNLIELGLLKTDFVRLFVLDEADKLLEPGSFQEQINWIYSMLPKNKQMLALSATYPEYLAKHLNNYMNEPVHIRLNIEEPTLLGIKQLYTKVSSHYLPHVVFERKAKKLAEFLRRVRFQQCMIFSNYQNRAQTLADMLSKEGWPASCIAGSQSQEDRFKAMRKLKEFKCRILISTDLTSRGIDCDKVDLVISLDLPWDTETYLHRVGRAGRFGGFGLAVNFVSEGKEEDKLMQIADQIKYDIELLPDLDISGIYDLGSLQTDVCETKRINVKNGQSFIDNVTRDDLRGIHISSIESGNVAESMPMLSHQGLSVVQQDLSDASHVILHSQPDVSDSQQDVLDASQYLLDPSQDILDAAQLPGSVGENFLDSQAGLSDHEKDVLYATRDLSGAHDDFQNDLKDSSDSRDVLSKHQNKFSDMLDAQQDTYTAARSDSQSHCSEDLAKGESLGRKNCLFIMSGKNLHRNTFDGMRVPDNLADCHQEASCEPQINGEKKETMLNPTDKESNWFAESSLNACTDVTIANSRFCTKDMNRLFSNDDVHDDAHDNDDDGDDDSVDDDAHLASRMSNRISTDFVTGANDIASESRQLHVDFQNEKVNLGIKKYDHDCENISKHENLVDNIDSSTNGGNSGCAVASNIKRSGFASSYSESEKMPCVDIGNSGTNDVEIRSCDIEKILGNFISEKLIETGIAALNDHYGLSGVLGTERERPSSGNGGIACEDNQEQEFLCSKSREDNVDLMVPNEGTVEPLCSASSNDDSKRGGKFSNTSGIFPSSYDRTDDFKSEIDLCETFEIFSPDAKNINSKSNGNAAETDTGTQCTSLLKNVESTETDEESCRDENEPCRSNIETHTNKDRLVKDEVKFRKSSGTPHKKLSGNYGEKNDVKRNLNSSSNRGVKQVKSNVSQNCNKRVPDSPNHRCTCFEGDTYELDLIKRDLPHNAHRRMKFYRAWYDAYNAQSAWLQFNARVYKWTSDKLCQGNWYGHQ